MLSTNALILNKTKILPSGKGLIPMKFSKLFQRKMLLLRHISIIMLSANVVVFAYLKFDWW